MNKLLIVLFTMFTIGFISCEKDDEEDVPAPSAVSNVVAEPIVGGVVVRWDLPSDDNADYVVVSYSKKDSLIKEVIGKGGDSLQIDGLINKVEYTFDVQSFNYGRFATKGGSTVTSQAVRPIRRGTEETVENSKLAVTSDMISTFTQEPSEGPKENLLDGDPSSYWHTAWSTGVEPLPHWVEIVFDTATEMNKVGYYFRANNTQSGRPLQMGLEVSENGTDWTRVWESATLTVDGPNTEEYFVEFDKIYQSKYFRVMILQTPNGATYVTLGEMEFLLSKVITIDLEQIAEENY